MQHKKLTDSPEPSHMFAQLQQQQFFCIFLAGTQEGLYDYCTGLALMVSKILFHKQKQDPCLINYS